MRAPTRRMVEVYEMLKDGKPLKFDTLVSRLGCKPVTAMVLLCALRRDYGADLETIRNGRKAEAYRLGNAAAIANKMVSKSKTPKAAKAAKPVKAQKVVVSKTKTTVSKKSKTVDVNDGVPTIDSDFDVSEVTDAELADLKNQLGLG